jgi:hypothetical protein
VHLPKESHYSLGYLFRLFDVGQMPGIFTSKIPLPESSAPTLDQALAARDNLARRKVMKDPSAI